MHTSRVCNPGGQYRVKETCMRDLPPSPRSNGKEPDLADIGPDLFMLHESAGGVIRAGRNARDIVGVEACDLSGRGFIEAIHVQDRVGVAKAISDCLVLNAGTKAQYRFMANREDAPAGRWYELRCAPAPQLAVQGGEAPVLSVTRDISARRRLEEHLRQDREKADSANTAKSLFLANMSHELRTPLNAILGFSELLQSDAMNAMPPERSREYVQLIHSSADHLLTVLNDILDMSKIEAGRYEIVTEPFDLAETLIKSAAILRGQADKRGIRICVGDFDSLPEVTADKRAIRQVMINLISNAVKFSHDNGVVRVSAKRTGASVEIEVSDDGIGISSEHMNRLGMPFYQADSRYDRKYEGTGLGLSVVCGLVELHHGKVSFASEKGAGTTVSIALPIVPPATANKTGQHEPEVIRLNNETGTTDANEQRVANMARQKSA